jgi:hypothetical protein
MLTFLLKNENLYHARKISFYGDLLASGRSLLTVIIQIKNELVVMKLHFRYHNIIFCSNNRRLNKDCKYCQDWIINTVAKEDI